MAKKKMAEGSGVRGQGSVSQNRPAGTPPLTPHPSPLTPASRAQPRLHWKQRAIPDRRGGEAVDLLFVAGDRVGEVLPVVQGNPLRGPVAGYTWATFTHEEWGIAHRNSGDRDGFMSGDRATARVALIEYVQACLRQRGLRP